MLNIIHNQYRPDRLQTLNYELNRQEGVEIWRLWPAILDSPVCKGVSRAHKQIVQFAKDWKIPEVIIAEDDIKFPAEDGFKYFLSKKPEDFDLYLGGIYRGEIKDGKTDDFSGLHLYIIKQKFYDTFLSINEEKHLDTELKGKGDYHVCYPFAAIQYSGYSDVERAKTNFEGLLTDKLIYQ
jgi:hypothetical protein